MIIPKGLKKMSMGVIAGVGLGLMVEKVASLFKDGTLSIENELSEDRSHTRYSLIHKHKTEYNKDDCADIFDKIEAEMDSDLVKYENSITNGDVEEFEETEYE